MGGSYPINREQRLRFPEKEAILPQDSNVETLSEFSVCRFQTRDCNINLNFQVAVLLYRLCQPQQSCETMLEVNDHFFISPKTILPFPSNFHCQLLAQMNSAISVSIPLIASRVNFYSRGFQMIPQSTYVPPTGTYVVMPQLHNCSKFLI